MKKAFKYIEKYVKILYYIYLFLFIFLMINREFLPFGIDMRYILLPIGCFLILYALISGKKDEIHKKEYFDKSFKLIFLFFIWILICNISWIWNNFKLNEMKYINEVILLLNNFIGLIVFFFYKQYLKKEMLKNIIIFSSLILVFSFLLIGLGVNLAEISGEDIEFVYKASEGSPNHINIYGGGYRVGGYAQDPNYASFLLIIAIVTSLQLNIKKRYKSIFTGIFIVAFGFAASKTIMLASIIGIIYIIFNKVTKFKYEKKLNIILLIGIICMLLVILNLGTLKRVFPSTMTTRFVMWESAAELFKISPIIGNGITSFRSYFEIDHWYVHSHSTYMQLLSETGIIGVFLFLRIMYNNLNKKNSYNKFLIIVYLIFAINFETIALQFFIYIIYLMQIEKESNKVGKKALFMINNLSDGGAERVSINMANELLKQGFSVDFILLNGVNEGSYKIDKRINIYDLKIKETNKIKKILKLLINIVKLDEIILENEKDEKYLLITTHLPMSNLLTRFSIIRNRAIYVLHTTMKYYDKNNNTLFKRGLKYIFKNKKVVAVSKGLKKECLDEYNMNYCNIEAIYNPVNIEELDKMKNEKINIEKPYILQVGRFSKEKRQDRMVDVFYRGKFYQDYQLVFCGSGETENNIKEKVIELGIEDNVIFLGWQDNIYKWMKNCELLMCTSDIEAFPMTLIEALICNAKIVSSNCNFGPSEILLNKQSEFLVDPDNIDEYIKKMNMALNEYPIDESVIIDKCKAENVIKEYIEFMNK